MYLTFYYVRHGETFFNQIGRVQGSCDSPLTKEGIADAYEAKKALEGVKFNRAYCSTCERAIDTAHIILEGQAVPITYTKDLKEFDFGKLDGCFIEEVREEIEAHKRMDDFSDLGGDNLESIQTKLFRVMEQAKNESEDGDTILLAAHGTLCRYVIRLLFQLDPYEVIGNPKALIPNGGIMKFAWNEDHYELLRRPVSPKDYNKQGVI